MCRPEPRSRAQRRVDTQARRASDVDMWVATASPVGVPHLVPLSFLAVEDAFLLATSASSVTVRNLRACPDVRWALGHTRDVSMFVGMAQVIETELIDDAIGDRFATHTGFDPRRLDGYCWLRLVPTAVQAWREVEEMAERDLMRAGVWLT